MENSRPNQRSWWGPLLLFTGGLMVGLAAGHFGPQPRFETGAGGGGINGINGGNPEKSGGTTRARDASAERENGDAEAGEAGNLPTVLDRLRKQITDSAHHPNPMRSLAKLGQLMYELSPEEIPDAVALMEEAVTGKNGRSMVFGVMALFSRWSEFDPEAAVARSREMAGGTLIRQMAFQGVMGGWMEKDPQSAMACLNGLESTAENAEIRSGAMGMMTFANPAKAALMAEMGTDPVRRAQEMAMVAGSWADSQPDEALRWVMGIKDQTERERLLPGVVRGWVKKAPEEALRFADALDNPSVRKSVLESALQGWATEDPGAAFAHLMKMPPDDRPEGALDSMSWAVSRLELPEIADFVEKIPDDKERYAFVTRLASHQAGRNPQAAAELAQALPEGKERGNALGNVASVWAKADPPGASEWLSGLPPSDSRDKAVVAFANEAVKAEPESALIWATSIGATDARDSTVRRLAAKWIEQDPAAARSWLNGTDAVADAVKAELLRTE